MRVLVLSAAAVAVSTGLAGCRHSSPASIDACRAGKPALAAPTAPMPSQPFVAVLHRTPDAPAMLARFDALSLRPRSRQVEIGEYHRAWSVSPDGRRLAVGVSAGGSALEPSKSLHGRIGIYIVDMQAMELVGEVQTGVAAVVLAWLAPRRLVAGLQRGGTVIVDPRTGRILRRWPRFSFPDAAAPTGDGVVLLLPELLRAAANMPLTRTSGSARLGVVDAHGRLRSVTLKRIRLAVRTVNGITYEDRAGLAVDAVGKRVWVAAADAPVAEIDLRTMRVSYHLKLPRLEADDERVASARQRRALWLGGGELAVFGHDLAAAAGASAARPAGVVVIDTGDWSACVLDEEAGGAALAAGRLLTYAGTRSTTRAGRRLGLSAYGVGGRVAYRVAGDEQVSDVDVAGGHAYVQTARGVRVVDLKSGNTVAHVAGPVEIASVISRSP